MLVHASVYTYNRLSLTKIFMIQAVSCIQTSQLLVVFSNKLFA